MPSLHDMNTSLEDARFFYEQMDPIIRGPQAQQDLVLIRRYFRGYLHCWKSILHFVRELKAIKNNDDWRAWCEDWQNQFLVEPSDQDKFKYLRLTRDHDTHEGMITVVQEVAAGLFPLVMFDPGKQAGPRTELISCCTRGLIIAKHLIQTYPNVS